MKAVVMNIRLRDGRCDNVTKQRQCESLNIHESDFRHSRICTAARGAALIQHERA